MNLENMILSDRSQSQKATYPMIPFIWHIQERKIHRQSRLVVDRDWGRAWRVTGTGQGFLLGWGKCSVSRRWRRVHNTVTAQYWMSLLVVYVMCILPHSFNKEKVTYLGCDSVLRLCRMSSLGRRQRVCVAPWVLISTHESVIISIKIPI